MKCTLINITEKTSPPLACQSGKGSPFSGTVWSGPGTEVCLASLGRGWWAHSPARGHTKGRKLVSALHRQDYRNIAAGKECLQTLTKSFRCRAQTRPSPPLLPGPQITSTEGLAFTREVSGYACRKTMTRQFYTAQRHSFSLQQIGSQERNRFIPLQVCLSLSLTNSQTFQINVWKYIWK